MPAASSIAIALVATGSVMSAMSAIQQSEAQASAMKFNAQVADRNAVAARQQARFDAEAQDKLGRMKIGAIRAGYGSAGAGSSEDVLAMSISNAELDKQSILYKGELRALGYTDEAALDRYGASVAITQGRQRAASEIIGGAGRAAGIYAGSGAGKPLSFDTNSSFGQTEGSSGHY
jgi:hypothetical protein